MAASIDRKAPTLDIAADRSASVVHGRRRPASDVEKKEPSWDTSRAAHSHKALPNAARHCCARAAKVVNNGVATT